MPAAKLIIHENDDKFYSFRILSHAYYLLKQNCRILFRHFTKPNHNY